MKRNGDYAYIYMTKSEGPFVRWLQGNKVFQKQPMVDVSTCAIDEAWRVNLDSTFNGQGGSVVANNVLK